MFNLEPGTILLLRVAYLKMQSVGCYVGQDDLDGDHIADTKALAGSRANDPVPFFLETVIVVNKARNKDEPFNEYPGEFHEKAE